MFYQDLTNYELPEVSIKCLKSDIDNDNLEKITKCITNHHFNSQITLHLPYTSSFPKKISESLLEDTSFYLVKDLSIEELCKSKFIQSFVKCGKFYAYTANTRIDIDNCAAFIPDGNLFLLLDVFTYQKLNISGKLSSHILRRPKNKYFIEIDTTGPAFKPDKKLFKNIQKAFKNCELKFDFYITWMPDQPTRCPSSIAKYFFELDYEVLEVEPRLKATVVSECAVLSPFHPSCDEEGVLAAWDWVGATALGIKSRSDVEAKTSDYSVCQVKGFFTPDHVASVIDKVRNWLAKKEQFEYGPWACVSVFGPTDSLISWAKTEHCFKSNGENLYSIFVTAKEQKSILISTQESKQPLRMYGKTSNK